MTCYRIPNGIICINPHGRLHVGNRYIVVSFHEFCGPSFEYMNGTYYDPKDENDPVWPEFEKWYVKYRAKKDKEAKKP